MRAKRLRSSLIDRIVFDDDAGTLTVSFRSNRRYLYRNVPRAIYDAFGRAKSAGEFFNDVVRGHYACEPLTPRPRYPLPE